MERPENGTGRYSRKEEGLNRSTILMAVILLVGCSSHVEGPHFTTRDSAGVRIVESWAPAWENTEGWALDGEAALDLSSSGRGPAHVFYRVAGATVLSDGRIVVADGGTGETVVTSGMTVVGDDGQVREIRGSV